MMTQNYISSRGLTTKDFPNFFHVWGARSRENSYHSQNNPLGVVDFGMAENNLCEDLWMDRLSKHDMVEFEPSMLYYSAFSGHISFREAVARFLTDRLNTDKPLDPSQVVMTNGVGTALDMLAHVLADPGDCLLSPSPYYTRIKTDFGQRSMVRLVDVMLSSQQEPGETKTFQLTVAKLEAAYHKARNQGLTVRGIILLNPHNPTGDVYSIELIKEILEFAKRYELHVIFNEIYAMTIYDDTADFQSVLTVQDLPDPLRTHFVWGFSKDFSLSGLRCGMLYSFNLEVIQAVLPLSYFGSVPYLIQKKLHNIILDTEWLDKVYFPTNLERMRTARQYCIDRLVELGIEVYMHSKATYFIWADFSRYLKPCTGENEMRLFEFLFERGVYIVPGCALYYTNPGWFRLVFTHPQNILEEGFRRLTDGLNAFLTMQDAGGTGDIVTKEQSNAAGGDSLTDLMSLVLQQIKTTDFLERNTPEQSGEENPEKAVELDKLKTSGKDTKLSDLLSHLDKHLGDKELGAEAKIDVECETSSIEVSKVDGSSAEGESLLDLMNKVRKTLRKSDLGK